jgi:predicted ATPase
MKNRTNKSESTTLTHNLTDTQLENELRRRGCAVVVITPADVIEQWQTNQDADATEGPAPTEAEAASALRQVQRMLDRTVHENEPAFEWGPASDACELIHRRRALVEVRTWKEETK